MTIGQRIGELRKSYGYSQEYIAEKMNVSRQAVSKWEQDLSAPDTYNLIALAELLDVSVEYLATGKKPPAPQELPSAPPAPPHRGIGASQIVGMILLCMGLFALILGFLFSEELIGIGAILMIYAIPCLAMRKHLGMALMWLTTVLLFFLSAMLMPVRVVGSTPDGGVMVLSNSSLLLVGFFVASILVTVVITVKAIAKRFHK